MAVPAPAINICIPASRTEEWQRREHRPSPRTLLRSYMQLLCVHSIDWNSITWPHLVVKAGWEKKYLYWRGMPPSMERGRGAHCHRTEFISWNSIGLLGRTHLYWMRRSLRFRTFIPPGPRYTYMPVVYNASHCSNPRLPHTEEVALAFNFRFLWQAFCLPRAVVYNFPEKYSS